MAASPQGAGESCASGSAEPRAEPAEHPPSSGPVRAALGLARHGRRRVGGSGTEVLAGLRPIFRCFLKPCQVCPQRKLSRTMRSASRACIPALRRRSRGADTRSAGAAQSRATASPYLASRPSSFFFQFSRRCLESAVSLQPRGHYAGQGGVAGRGSPPACLLPERRLCRGLWVRAVRRKGARVFRAMHLHIREAAEKLEEAQADIRRRFDVIARKEAVKDISRRPLGNPDRTNGFGTDCASQPRLGTPHLLGILLPKEEDAVASHTLGSPLHRTTLKRRTVAQSEKLWKKEGLKTADFFPDYRNPFKTHTTNTATASNASFTRADLRV